MADDLTIDWDLIARGRDRGGKPTQLTEAERDARREHWLRLKVELENRGIFTTPWEAFHRGEMPEDLAQPLRDAIERTQREEIRRAPTPKRGWEDWMKVGSKVRGIGKWRKGRVGTVIELREQGAKTYAIVQFEIDNWAFEPGEIELVEEEAK